MEEAKDVISSRGSIHNGQEPPLLGWFGLMARGCLELGNSDDDLGFGPYML